MKKKLNCFTNIGKPFLLCRQLCVKKYKKYLKKGIKIAFLCFLL
ncbi:MAG: hypothetical protein RL757_937 [Bacteroidota bacterium]|jgi:hypothetical protein